VTNQLDYTMILVKKIDDKWYTQGSMLSFNNEIELKEGAILFPRQYDKLDLTYWPFQSSVEEYDSSI